MIKRRKRKDLEQLKKENIDLKGLLGKIDERVKHIKHIETLTFDQIKKIKPKLVSIERELDIELEDEESEDEEEKKEEE
tara:strand:- start:508 stop:744 length:237 start_codon:yes stop_codon:yes gene_type:complete